MKRPAIICLLFLGSPALAHDWYDEVGCCSGNDCDMIAPDAVQCNGSDKCWVTVDPQQHRFTKDLRRSTGKLMFTAPVIFEFERNKIRTSPDNQNHACVYLQWIGDDPHLTGRCVFIGGSV